MKYCTRLSGRGWGRHRHPTRPLRGDRPFKGLALGLVDGRLDLRGLVVPSPDVARAFRAGGMDFVEMAGVHFFRGVCLKGADLSHADIPALRAHGCRFEDCLFEKAKLEDLRMWACEFYDCSFKGADLRNSILGARKDKIDMLYDHVDFSAANLQRSSSSTAIFRDCNFSGANLRKFEFDGSRLFRCTFAGLVREVIFRDHSILGHEDAPANTMEDVDFSLANLRWVEFHGLDLDKVTFPQDSRHLVIHDYRCVLECALEYLGDSQGVEHRVLRGKLQFRLKAAGQRQRVGVFNLDDAIESGGEPMEKFWVDILSRAQQDCQG